MKRFFIIGVVGLALAGCSSDKITPAESILLSCDAFASALTVLTPLRADGKLSDGTVKLVDQTRAVVDPICTGDAPDVDATVKNLAVDNGVTILTAIAKQFIK